MMEQEDARGSALRRDARRWVTQLASGEATAADAHALERWRHQSTAHEAAFVDAVRVWKSLEPGGRAFIETHGRPVWSGHAMRLRRRAFLGGALAAASAAVGYGVVHPPFDLWPSLEELTANYRTGTGEQKHVALGGVAIELNTQTSLDISAQGAGANHVTLIAGEAAFSIPQDLRSRSLIVVAGNGRTVASRASFTVRNIGEDVCVTCLDGEVRVESSTQAMELRAGRQVGYNRGGFKQALDVNPAEATSWRDGFIVFRYTSISAAVAEINRYRPGRVILLNAALGRKEVSGRFRIARIDEVLTWIEQVAGAQSRTLPGGIVLLS
ncbi:MAG: FecR domain-containing protein [Pseudomonadota bacterium]